MPCVWGVCVGFLGLPYKVLQTRCLEATEMCRLPQSQSVTSAAGSHTPSDTCRRPCLTSHKPLLAVPGIHYYSFPLRLTFDVMLPSNAPLQSLSAPIVARPSSSCAPLGRTPVASVQASPYPGTAAAELPTLVTTLFLSEVALPVGTGTYSSGRHSAAPDSREALAGGWDGTRGFWEVATQELQWSAHGGAETGGASHTRDPGRGGRPGSQDLNARHQAMTPANSEGITHPQNMVYQKNIE